MIYSTRIQKAIQFASQKHRDQKRTILNYPYITHPLMVFHLVSKFSHDEDILCAAILHDTVEDTETILSEIEEHFGKHVRYLVDILSEDKALEKVERKEKYYKRIFKENNKDVYLIKSADILYNLTDIVNSYQKTLDLKDIMSFSAYIKRIREVNLKLKESWIDSPFFSDIRFYLDKLDILFENKKIIEKVACGIFPVYVNSQGKREFLLIKSNNGKIAQPKGHMEQGETFLETAKRELFEETGLECSKIYSDYIITEQYIIQKNKPIEKTVHSFVGFVDTKKIILQEEEVSEYFWVSSDQAIEMITFPEQKESFKEMLILLNKLN